MPDISTKLLGAGASAKNDWAKADAATSLSFTGEAELRRGFELTIGLNALATADAGLSKFVDATARGNAFAEATASLQVRLPLNLFDEFGVMVGAQAIAQAAAGIEVGLGLSIGDFIALIRQNPESEGLPLDLVVLLLDECVVGGKVEVHVAAAAMAYASISITGEVVKEPGFHIVADAGLGLAAGVGFSGSLDLDFRDFRRFYGRAVDRTVQSVIDGLTPSLTGDLARFRPSLRVLGPISATALRAAFEIGNFIAKNDTSGHQGALDLSNHCVGIILEEAQRFLFSQFLEAGLRSLQHLVTDDVPNLRASEWVGLMPQRRALADVLYRMPAEPFQPSADNASYWSEMVGKTTDLIAQLPDGVGAPVTHGLTIVFAATQLLTDAIRRKVNRADAYAFTVAGGVASPKPPFSGALANAPGPRIRHQINAVLHRSPDHSIDYPDLVAYLIGDAATSTLRAVVPSIDDYLSVFKNPAIAGGLTDVLRVLVQNRDAFVKATNGDRDPQATLRVLLGVLDDFITIKINGDLVPAINRQIANGNVKLFFDEVLVGTLLYVKEVAFQTVLDWEAHPVDSKAFTEALAGVMTMLLGRSLVLVGDGFMAALQADMHRACDYAATRLEGAHDPFTAIGISASPELKALVTDTLRICGEVFGPLPDDTRSSLRSVLYDVMETLPPTATQRAHFLTNLADQFFIPNQESLNELSGQLLAISRQRFQLFTERVLEAGGTFVLDALEDTIQQAIHTVLQWVGNLEVAMEQLVNQLQQLDRLIQTLTAAAQQAFQRAADEVEALLNQLASSQLRSTLRQTVADYFYGLAKSVLDGNVVYRNLPREARQFVRNVLRNAIDDLIEGPLLNPMFNALGALAGDLSSILEDVRDLNPDQPLGPQLLDLVVDRMEDQVRDAFGGSHPRIDVGFTANPLGFMLHFSLGTFGIPFDTLFRQLRTAIHSLNFYQNTLNQAAAAVADAFRASLDLGAKRADRRSAQDNHDRLARIRGEFTSVPKEISVVSPVQSLVYDGDVDVHVNLGHMPQSYLGLAEDEQQRVLIFLNGMLIPAQGVALGDLFVSLDSERLRVPIDLDREKVSPAASITSAAGLGLSTDAPSAPTRVLGSTVASPPLEPGLRPLATRPAAASARPFVRQSTLEPRDDSPSTVTSVLSNVLPGRRLTITKRARFEKALPPGTVVRFRVDRSRLAVGTNTLVVVIIDPGGQRYQQIVSFGVTAAPKRAGDIGLRLPGVAGRKRSGQPAANPNGVDLHFNQQMLARRQAASRDFIAQSSPLLKNVPRPKPDVEML